MDETHDVLPMETKFQTIGKNFILNIAQPENVPNSILVTNRDPRKQRIKPDAYVGIVEEVGARCELVRPGMRVVVKRWEYRQHDVDDERIVAQERELLILNDTMPAPDVVVLKILPDKMKTNLTLPQTMKPKPPATYFGEVIAANCKAEGEPIMIGDLLWVERRDRDQFFQGHDRLVFKNTADIWNGESPILIRGKRVPHFEVV